MNNKHKVSVYTLGLQVLLLLLVLYECESEGQSTKPNVVIIFADDVRLSLRWYWSIVLHTGDFIIPLATIKIYHSLGTVICPFMDIQLPPLLIWTC